MNPRPDVVGLGRIELNFNPDWCPREEVLRNAIAIGPPWYKPYAPLRTPIQFAWSSSEDRVKGHDRQRQGSNRCQPFRSHVHRLHDSADNPAVPRPGL